MSLPYRLTKTLLCALMEMQGVMSVTDRTFLNTTLNFKHNLEQDTLPADKPKISYFSMGINGVKNLDSQNLSAPYVPSSSNMDLFEPLPFRVVPVNEDLDPSERELYRMRVLKTVGSDQYWCYYLKKLSITDNSVKIIETDLTTGVETEVDSFDPNHLNPIPSETTAEAAVQGETSTSVVVNAELNITGEEVIEGINILYSGNLLRAKVSELGIYSGEDKIITGDNGIGGTISYTEAIYTQMMYHYCSLGSHFDQSKIENIKMRFSSSNSFVV